jgi:flagellin
MNALKLSQSMHRLASGSRINRGADDPAGLIASQSLYATLAALDAETTANERASQRATTADAALGEVSGLLTEAKTLVAANANEAGLTPEEKAANQLQIDSILSSVDRLAGTTSFASQKLLDGSATISASGKSLAISSTATANIGSTEVGGQTYKLSDIKGGKNANAAVAVVDQAIKDVATQRAKVGAFDKHTLQTRIANIANSREQLLSAVSMIADTNYAAEASNNMRLQFLQQASYSNMRSINRRRTGGSTFSVLA